MLKWKSGFKLSSCQAETSFLQPNAFGFAFPVFLKSLISTKLSGTTTVWGVGMFLHCYNEVQMCCCCWWWWCPDPLPAQAENLSYLFNHLKLMSSNPPLPKSFLALGGGGQDTRQTRQTPPPTSGSTPPCLCPSLPVIPHASPFYFYCPHHHPSFFFLLFISFAAINVPFFYTSPCFFFFCIQLRPAPAGLTPHSSMQSWPTPM